MRPRRRLLPAALLAALLTFVLGAVALAPTASALQPGELVRTAGGVVRGKVTADRREFLGIPYAAPPTGQRRFRPPAPAAPWLGVRNATTPGFQCPQVFIGFSNEDCLVLNVVTPPAPRSRRLPVMVFLHGGSYLFGAAAGYDPAPMVTRHDVIYVGINYRLGPLGFLALPGLAAESGTTGNYGVLDQQAALRWVRRNIAAFGGDPGNVTLYGQSAGGNAVCANLVSPTAAGLFHKAISMSGACGRTSLGPAPASEAYRTATGFASKVGCTDAATAASCLRGKSADELMAQAGTAFDGHTDLDWIPTIDGKVIKEPVLDALASGRYNRVPLLLGTTREEGRLFQMSRYHLSKFRPATAAEHEAALRAEAGRFAAEALPRYPAASPTNADIAASAVVTDSLFACPAAFLAQTAAKRPGQRVWQYELLETGPLSGLDPFMPLGSYHSADLAFVFAAVQGLPVSLDEKQQRLARQITQYWATFARTGNPNARGLPAWPAYTRESPKVQRLTSAGSAPTRDFPAAHNCDLWRKVAGL